jgi:phosphoserine aminotransferase
MFSPNSYKIKISDVNIHHRGIEFKEIIREIQLVFREKFCLPDTHAFFVYNGSGSQTMDKLLQSLNVNVEFNQGPGKFLSRWRSYSEQYYHNGSKCVNGTVQFETSISQYNPWCMESVVDAVCAFPYYDYPLEADFVVSVTSKILAAAPVLGIVIYRKDALNKISKFPGSIYDWIEYNDINQTPFTPSIPLYTSFLNSLLRLDVNQLRKKVDHVSDLIIDIFGTDSIIGDLRAPAISVSKDYINEKRCADLGLYGTHNNSNFIQIFTYSHDIDDYERLLPYLKR